MPDLPSFERLRCELRRRGLPRAYLDRLIGEWSDHYQDLLSELSSKEAEMPQSSPSLYLGDEAELADAAVRQYRARTFAGRHPVWTFIAAPLPLTIACWALFYAVLIGAVMLASDAWRPESATMHGLTQFVFQLSYALPPVAAVLILAWLARRSGQPVVWFGAACFLVALLAASHHPALALPVGRGKGSLAIGFGLGYSMAWQQGLLPLAIGALCWLRMRRAGNSPDAPTPDCQPLSPLHQAA